ncbi:carboxymuconolactone decarboxylase family protein [Methylosinus sp. H3A]|uniref:carboxymuconolactone decarboxylase family protein n=1 Tax=Methylosinus sp. H3A TaxID=2785786 RepID=UPI0018C2D76A|nr:carboxymuconolactone decarboxylase family protein [Methylosinus sp. H3A]MBG0808041.1 carboxymuconolactone decarboxylase family protein [Methylosinus sp. H3A]
MRLLLDDVRLDGLTSAERDKIILALAQILMQAAGLSVEELDDDKIDKVDALSDWRNSPLFSPDEQLALEYAGAMTFTEPGVSDSLRAKLTERDDVIIELTGLIAFQSLSSKFNAALDVPA